MSWTEKIDNWMREFIASNTPEPKAYRARPLTQEEVDDMLDAAYNPLRDQLIKSNPYRWRRFIADFKWVRREMIKMGLDPREVGKWL